VCRDSAVATRTNGEVDGPPIDLDLASDIPTALLDGERLRTALVNVLTNACAAVQEPRELPVAAARGALAVARLPNARGVLLQSRLDGTRIAIVVRDSGPGIRSEDLAHVFDPYFTTRRGGTGLGLPIAKNIVEGLGGTITVRSEPGTGTEIRIELPLRPEARA
jgi:signal transduction histidine kinase